MHNLTHLPPAIFLMGPTASGKSQLALDIAENFPVEIISVDSAQVYRYMDIGTAKPDQATLSRTPHHLVNLIDPDQHYSAAQFRDDALNIMHEITRHGKIPLLVGGTMLYFRALQEGLSLLPPADHNLRLMLENMAKEVGWSAMHQRLAELDQETAARIKPTDSQRIQRALEVCYLTQRPMSEILNMPRQTNFPYHKIRIALIPSERSQLHLRIAERFEVMLNCGLIEEVQSIRQQFPFLSIESPSMRSVGYRQTCFYLDNKIKFSELRNMGIAATRQLAKRQLTWLRSMKTDAMQEFDCLTRNLTAQVQRFLQESLG
ncbi:tRNA (adenosine(37)-N6)-dimethylallyltransferase MiaA [Nitrosomonas sp. Nm166]|uniref:tRNA (adenosine(37)-N6)-dimethylallyltransferase MiaA n=1 Tax=Nitrosomonas sp. Nm166 TaxID=1881054 RepID=UPI0008F23F5A|nr:tRNA (adenosine(37)-N6)-dimethylallyltransferase MiaA [Nitrosomonas sp. Nm166]SFE49624.1 tRNA dimethylallyltransferase [Nitrosomonas sp. Nm166]